MGRENVNDAMPLLVLALLRQERGDEEAVNTLLEQARKGRDANGRIDAVVGQLGLSAARNNASEQPSAIEFWEGSDRP